MQKSRNRNIIFKLFIISILAIAMLMINKTESNAAYNASNNTITGVAKGDGTGAKNATIKEGDTYSIWLQSVAYDQNGTVPVTTDFMFLTHKNVYCIMRGWMYAGSFDYTCVGIKKLDDKIGAKVGYAVSKQELEKRTIFLDAITNLIWTFSDSTNGNSTCFDVNGYTEGNILDYVPLNIYEGMTMENGVKFSWSIDPNYLYRVLWMRSDGETGVLSGWQSGPTPQYIIDTWAKVGYNNIDANSGTMSTIDGIKSYFDVEKVKFDRYKKLADLAPSEKLSDQIISGNSGKISKNEKGLYGPFKIEYLSAEHVPDNAGTDNTYMLGKVTITIDGKAVSAENIVDAAGNPCTIPVKLDEYNGTVQQLPKSGTEFYIKADNIKTESELEIKYDYNIYSSAFARFHRNGYKSQDLAYIDYELKPQTISKKFTLTAKPSILIGIYKYSNEKIEDNVILHAKFQIVSLTGATIDENSKILEPVVGSNGATMGKTVITPEEGAKEITIEIQETEALAGHTPYKENIKITLTCDEQGKWDIYGRPETPQGETIRIRREGADFNPQIIIDATNKKAPSEELSLKLIKEGPNRESVTATFEVNVNNAIITNNGLNSSTYTFTTDGNGITLNLKATDITKPVRVTLQETITDSNYIQYDTVTIIEYTYNEQNGTWSSKVISKSTYTKNGSTYTANITSIKVQVNEFSVTLTNDKKPGIIPPSTNVGGIVWLDGQQGLKPVTSPNGYRDGNEPGVAGVKVILYKRYVAISGKSYSQNIQNQLNKEQYVTEVYTSSNGTFSFGNLPTVEYITAQHDGKHDDTNNPIYHKHNATCQIICQKTDPDHIHDKDCYNCKKDENTIVGYQQIACTHRDKVDVEYKVKFIYDGVNFKATTASTSSPLDKNYDSDASEIGRTSFNRKFATISDSNTQGLSYDYSSSARTSTLITGYDRKSTSPIYAGGSGLYSKFKMTAETAWISNTTNSNNISLDNISFGLIRRGVDLATVTDVYSAAVRINGEETKYNYNDISNLNKNQYGNPIIDNLQGVNVTYNLYLYNSDYNYRIKDYKLDAAHKEDLAVNVNNASNELLTQRQNDGDLEVEVVYQVLLNNQSAANATIRNIAYYSDNNYKLKEVYYYANGAKRNLSYASIGTKTINNTNFNKIKIDTSRIAQLDDSNNQTVLYLSFTINKTNGGVILGTKQNWVEISEYYTSEGLIDCDSEPGNLESGKFEDDSDDASGLSVKLNSIEREVKGYVFEDIKTSNPGEYNIGNGQYDSGENKIDDVIVQLIEIKDVTIGSTTLRLEYIWQETVSGSNKVKYVTSDGTSYGEYTVSNGEGEYTFKGFIPGNYIVRFIYGDGTYWDTAKNTQNILKYNGQDYKSTVDRFYTENKWNETGYNPNDSMARDNEARRLEEMAYARNISQTDVSKLIIDSKDKLQDTWMCAETSIIEMNVTKSDNDDKWTADNGDSSTTSISKQVNFGLVERPRANLILEKHITALIIEAETRTEAITNFANYAAAVNNGLKVDLITNLGEGVFATATNKEQNQRGVWLVQMEPAKLAGRRIQITYGYGIKNIGDGDDIGVKLVAALNSGKTYEQVASDVKTLSSKPGYVPGAYLGTAYYDINGTRAAGDTKSRIPFQVEDYTSTATDGLLLDTTSSFAIAVNRTQKPVWTYQSVSADSGNAVVAKEDVSVIQSKNIFGLYANEPTYSNGDIITLTVYDDSIDSTNGSKELTYRSYAAQLIYPTTGVKTSATGTLNKGATLESLGKNGNGTDGAVQSYVHLDESTGGVPISTITPEVDEFIAETVTITLDTGADKQTPVMLIISITAGLAVIVIGIVVIKKFIIK